MESQRRGPYGQVVLFGDSLTQMSASQEWGFAFMPALQNYYIRRLDVINRGFSGYNTTLAINVLQEFMPTPEQASIRLMTIFFGANDACLPGNIQHVPLEQYMENLRCIIQHPMVEAHQPRLLLITPPPVNEHARAASDVQERDILPSRTAINTKRYAEACSRVGKDSGIVVLDLWTRMMETAGWDHEEPLPGSIHLPENPFLKRVLSDGLHFTPEGYKFLFQEVIKIIEEHWPESDGLHLPMAHAHWEKALQGNLH